MSSFIRRYYNLSFSLSYIPVQLQIKLPKYKKMLMSSTLNIYSSKIQHRQCHIVVFVLLPTYIHTHFLYYWMQSIIPSSIICPTHLDVFTGQRYFQCIYIPGKHAQYPLRPFTPAMSPTVMSPALKSMLDQHRAARTSGQ